MGSEGRFDYTAIGDTINLASRLEGANKFFNTIIMASQTTVDGLGNGIVSRPLDRVRVKGKSEPILLYEIVGERGEVTDDVMSLLVEPYLKAFDLFQSRNIDDAKRLFEAILKRCADDGPSGELLKRCERALAEPQWDLVTDLLSK
jgi:adenylate cyclase